MFDWKVEQLALLKEKGNRMVPKGFKFNCENTLSQQEKIAFVNQRTNGSLGYLLELQQKFNEDVANLPHDKSGNVKMTSLKAWLKRNDNKNMIDKERHYGQMRMYYDFSIQSPQTSIRNIANSSSINAIFHSELLKCLEEERQYFVTHDGYEILKTSLKEKMSKYGTTFGVKICLSSDGKVTVGDFRKDRPIEKSEIRKLLKAYDELERITLELSQEIIKDYDKSEVFEECIEAIAANDVIERD